MLYKVTKTDKSVIATVGVPRWIKRLPNGFLVICSEAEAEGIAVFCEPYHLEGKKGLEEFETVRLVPITEQEYEEEIISKQQELLDIITGEVVADENTD
jgi:hypothetical protein